MGSKRRWSDDENAHFMQLYEKHECLWNPKHPDYKHKETRDAACRAVIREVRIPEFQSVSDMKSKINNFRSTYAQEVKKIKDSIYCDNGKYMPTLRWFPYADKFLRSVVSAKHPSDFILDESQNEIPLSTNNNTSSNDPLSDTENLQIDIKNEDTRDSEFEVLTCILPSDDADPEKPSSSVGRQSEGHRRPKRQRMRSPDTNSLLDSMDARNPPKDDDEFFHFGNNVGSQLRSLPLESALICQSKILDLLREERMTILKTQKRFITLK